MSKKKWLLWSLMAAMTVSALSQAAVRKLVLPPIFTGSTVQVGNETVFAGWDCKIGKWPTVNDPDHYAWLRYAVPAMAGQRIIFAYLDIDVQYQMNGAAPAGVRIARVLDPTKVDVRVAHTEASTEENGGLFVDNRLPAGPTTGLVVSNVTDLLDPNASLANGFSIAFRLGLNTGGYRGCYFDPTVKVPYLTIFVQDLSDLPSDSAPWSKGHDILMRKGLQLGAVVFPENNWGTPYAWNQSIWDATNFTTVNTWWDANHNGYTGNYQGLWCRLGGTLALPTKGEMELYPNLVSWQWGDEQDVNDPDERAVLISYIQFLKGKLKDLIVFANFTGNRDETAIIDYMNQAQPDMLSLTLYPWEASGLGNNCVSNLYTLLGYLQKYRLLGLQGPQGGKPIPYHVFYQCIAYNGTVNGCSGNAHFPSDSELRLSQFAAWAMGYKAATAFILDKPERDVPSWAYSALYEGPGYSNPRPQVAQLAETNRQSRNLGDTLVRLISTSVSVAKINPLVQLPPNVPEWSAGTDPYISAISATNVGGAWGGQAGPVMVGYFKPLDGSLNGGYPNDPYFMIVNCLTHPTSTVAQTAQQITLTFTLSGTGASSLLRLSRDTGQVEVVPLTSLGGGVYQLVFTLPGGTGDLFKLNNGVPFITGPYVCGNPGSALAADITGSGGQKDCKVNLYDFDALSEKWQAGYPKTVWVNPTESRSIGNSAYLTGDLWCGKYWYSAINDYASWKMLNKFVLPTLQPNEYIKKAYFWFDVADVPNYEGAGYGFYVRYVPVDNWDPDDVNSVNSAFASAELPRNHTIITSNDPSNPDTYEVDVTTFVLKNGEGPGQPITLDSRILWENGGLSCWSVKLKLIIDIIDPADIGASGLLRDNQFNIYDLRALVDEWLCDGLTGDCL